MIEPTPYSVEFIPPNFALAYSALARRASAAHAYLDHDDYRSAKGELIGAMEIIKQLETTTTTVIRND